MIKTFIKRPVFTTMLILVLVVFGIRSYPGLGVDLTPDVELPVVSVTVTYSGASPEEMETLVAKPIENRVSRVSGIKTISSSVREGFSQTMLEFELGTDPRDMASEIREKVASVRRSLPSDIDEPVVQRFDVSARSIASYTFASDRRSPAEVRRILNEVVVDDLQRVPGVAEVAIVGASDRAIKIHVNPERLRAYGISYQTILNKINNSNVNVPGGKIRDAANTITVRTMGKFSSIDDFKKIVVANVKGHPVMLTDVANVEDGWEDIDTFSRSNGVPCVLLMVRKQSQTNTVDVIDGVNRELKRLEKEDLPPDIHVDIVKDQSQYVRDNIGDVWNTIIFGGFLALLITYLFLRDIRATIIGGLSIPTSIVATFFMMKSMGFTLNNMSLMALSLAVGFLIDDAIVLVENIFRHMEMGQNPMLASETATKELSLAILATSLSLLAVFIPIGSMGEIVGQFFKQFGLTVAFALMFSTLAAFTLTPMVSAHWLKDYTKEKRAERPAPVQKVLDTFEKGFQGFREEYNRLMDYAIKRPVKIIIIAFSTLVLNLALLPFVGSELQPVYDSGEFSVNFKAPAGTGIDKMEQLVLPMEEEIGKLPEVRVAAMRVGGYRSSSNEGSIEVKLKPASERSRSMQEIMNDLRRKFAKDGNLRISVSSNQGGGHGDSRPVQIGIRGSDMKKLDGYAAQLADLIRQVPGAADVDVSVSDAEPEIKINLDQYRASRLGLDTNTVGSVVKYAFQGKNAKNTYTIGDNDYNIILQVERANRRTMEDVKNLRISTADGSFVRLGDIADVTLESGPTRIDREGRQRQVVVYANTVGISSGELINTIKEKLIPELNMDIGYKYSLIGSSDVMGRVFHEIAKAILLAIVMIYMVLAAEFESLTQPFVIMMSLPFAVIGAILGLLVANQTANMMSLIGFTMLLGLVTKNAILLIDYANQARERGLPLQQAVLEACSLRLRPIMMTTLSTLLGMVPIALGLGAGAEIRQSMGVVLIGGLTTSTLLTLVVVPLIYLLTEGWKERRRKKSAGAEG